MENKKLKLTFEDWDYTCSDGCCYESGTKLKIDEVHVSDNVALAERQAALSYSSSIVGQRVNEGIVTSIDRNAFGELTAKVSGKDLILAIDRTKSGRG